MQITMFVIILVSFIAGTPGFLTTVPENAAVTEGETVVMKCRTNNTMKKIIWRAPLSENLPRKIISGERTAEEWSHVCYVNNSLPGQYDLIMNSTMSAGTQYVCQEGPYGHEKRGSMGTAELVVLAADPNCSINGQIEDEMVKLNEAKLSFEMRCSVRYSGNWTPLMEWRQEGCQEPIYTGVNTTVQNDTIISALTVSANATYNITRYICTTRFDKRHKPSSTTADNVPNYSYNWTSPIIIVITKDPDVTQLCNSSVTSSSYVETTASSQLTSIISVIAVLQGILLAILLLLLLRRHIKKKTPSNTLDLDVARQTDISQNTGHGTSETILENGLYDTVPPAYAIVNHPIATEQIAMVTEQYAIYSKVKEIDEDQADDENETPQRTTDPVHRYPNIGADGTVYTELPAMKSTNCSQQQTPMKILFHTSMYAQIDHTAKVPPPPPQSTEFLR